MSTIPGQNIVIQQSGAVHEATHHIRPNQPLPEQLAGLQALRESAAKSSVQESEKIEKLKERKETKSDRRERKRREKEKKRLKRKQADGSTGSLLNTIA